MCFEGSIIGGEMLVIPALFFLSINKGSAFI